jgi:hypothetical protein
MQKMAERCEKEKDVREEIFTNTKREKTYQVKSAMRGPQ